MSRQKRPRRTPSFLRRLLLEPNAQQVLHVDHTDDVLRRSVVYREARVLIFVYEAQQLRQRQIHGDRYDIGARNHDLRAEISAISITLWIISC